MRFQAPGSGLCLISSGIPYVFLHMGGRKQADQIARSEQSEYLKFYSNKTSEWIMEFCLCI